MCVSISAKTASRSSTWKSRWRSWAAKKLPKVLPLRFNRHRDSLELYPRPEKESGGCRSQQKSSGAPEGQLRNCTAECASSEVLSEFCWNRQCLHSVRPGSDGALESVCSRVSSEYWNQSPSELLPPSAYLHLNGGILARQAFPALPHL